MSVKLSFRTSPKCLFILRVILPLSQIVAAVLAIEDCLQVEDDYLEGRNISQLIEDSDAIVIGHFHRNGSDVIFHTKRSFKDPEVPYEIILKGASEKFSDKENAINVGVFLNKISGSFYKLHDQDLLQKSMNISLAKKFLYCLEYHLLEEEETQILARGYLQAGWRDPELYYTEKGHPVSLTCKTNATSSNRIIEWHLNGTQFADGKEIAATEEGVYECRFRLKSYKSRNSSVHIKVHDKTSSLLELYYENKLVDKKEGDDVKWTIRFLAYPKDVIFTLEHEGRTVLTFGCGSRNEDNYSIHCDYGEGRLQILFQNVSVRDAGTYNLTATVQGEGMEPKMESVSLDLEIINYILNMSLRLETPAGSEIPRNQLVEVGQGFVLTCTITGYPVADVFILFNKCQSSQICSPGTLEDNELQFMEKESSDLKSYAGVNIQRWRGTATSQGIYLCEGKNRRPSDRPFKSNEVILGLSDDGKVSPTSMVAKVKTPEGATYYSVNSSVVDVIAGDNVTIICKKNKMADTQEDFEFACEDVNIDSENFVRGDENFAKVLTWNLGDNLMRYNGATIKCGSAGEMKIAAKEPVAPKFADPDRELFKKVLRSHEPINFRSQISLSCEVTGIPTPIIRWTKNEETVENYFGRIWTTGTNREILTLRYLHKSDSGFYKCNATNRKGSVSDSVGINVHSDTNINFLYVGIAAAAIILFVGFTLVFVVYVATEKRRLLRLKLEDLEYFKRGAPACLNPELELTTQAELLPYDNRYEVQRKKIEFERLLGKGEFGQVFLAKVDNLRSGERRTTVAVKMARSSTNLSLLEGLKKEIKIMIHIGRHANIVNLLGVCTEGLAKRDELLLLVEYCHYGNLRDYLIKHKKEFMQTYPSALTQIGREGSSPYAPARELLTNMAVPVLPGASPLFLRRTVKELSPVTSKRNSRLQPSGSSSRSKETSGEKKLKLRDLFSWSHQIGKGMEYLSARKVVHGDLAARNVLLHEDYIVKISDFGFAKDVYYKNYKKQGQSQLSMPMKWMSPEYIKDEVRSIQSDVWAYGITLWEIFSLGEAPYVGIRFDDTFVENILMGYRLPRPKYAPKEIYKAMLDCWNNEPECRPSFSALVEKMAVVLAAMDDEDTEFSKGIR